MIEALAAATELPAVGSMDSSLDATLTSTRELGESLKLEWTTRRARSGFFLRAEDFFGFAKRIEQMRSELERDLAAIDNDPSLSERSRLFARMPFASQLGELDQSHGPGIDTQSHGEQLLDLFASRIVAGGLHLLDEPEAPLSPNRQLTLISIIRQQMAERDCQFILATHSPLLMALPEATIYFFDESGITPASYESLDHVRVTRDFLNDPESFLRFLK